MFQLNVLDQIGIGVTGRALVIDYDVMTYETNYVSHIFRFDLKKMQNIRVDKRMTLEVFGQVECSNRSCLDYPRRNGIDNIRKYGLDIDV